MSVEIIDWTVGPGSAGPRTFFVTDGTMPLRLLAAAALRPPVARVLAAYRVQAPAPERTAASLPWVSQELFATGQRQPAHNNGRPTSPEAGARCLRQRLSHPLLEIVAQELSGSSPAISDRRRNTVLKGATSPPSTSSRSSSSDSISPRRGAVEVERLPAGPGATRPPMRRGSRRHPPAAPGCARRRTCAPPAHAAVSRRPSAMSVSSTSASASFRASAGEINASSAKWINVSRRAQPPGLVDRHPIGIGSRPWRWMHCWGPVSVRCGVG
jgi:hypothetical protein